MSTSVLRAVRAALAAPNAPRAGEHVVVAASGGPDSTALLDALATSLPPRGIGLSVVHVHHALRGTESDDDAAAVEALAARFGVACIVVPATVAPGPNLEARAREARHRALRRVAATRGAACIALGHTQDDQVETLLLRLLRGTGRRGLGAMAPRRGRAWRPLLAATRADVRRHLAVRGLPYRLDRTNADLRHTRNRLRRLVVPLLARELNPRLGATVGALADRLREEDAFLAAVVTTKMDAHRRGAALATTVAAEPIAIARRLVRAWLETTPAREVSAAHVERVLALATGARRGDVAVRGPGRIVREGDRLVHRSGRRAIPAPFHHAIEPGTVVDGPHAAWRLAVSAPQTCGPEPLAGLSTLQARFDADRLATPLVVRSVRPGDRIAIPGVGTRKLQDVLVDAKVPREQRRLVPIVVDGAGTIVWVAGVARGAAARVDADTRRIVDMRLAWNDVEAAIASTADRRS